MTGENSLAEIFGVDGGGDARARARRSTRTFVRSIDQLAVLEAELAKGHPLTALEALDAYGLEKLQEAVAEGSALLAESPTSAGQAIRARRFELGLEVKAVAKKSGQN